MKYKIIIEATIDCPSQIDVLPHLHSPEGIAEQLANLAITDTNIQAESSVVLDIIEVNDEKN